MADDKFEKDRGWGVHYPRSIGREKQNAPIDLSQRP